MGPATWLIRTGRNAFLRLEAAAALWSHSCGAISSAATQPSAHTRWQRSRKSAQRVRKFSAPSRITPSRPPCVTLRASPLHSVNLLLTPFLGCRGVRGVFPTLMKKFQNKCSTGLHIALVKDKTPPKKSGLDFRNTPHTPSHHFSTILMSRPAGIASAIPLPRPPPSLRLSTKAPNSCNIRAERGWSCAAPDTSAAEICSHAPRRRADESLRPGGNSVARPRKTNA